MITPSSGNLRGLFCKWSTGESSEWLTIYRYGFSLPWAGRSPEWQKSGRGCALTYSDLALWNVPNRASRQEWDLCDGKLIRDTSKSIGVTRKDLALTSGTESASSLISKTARKPARSEKLFRFVIRSGSRSL